MARDIGIDLGTANTLVYMNGKGIIIREPSVVAKNKNTGEILAIGDAAKRMIGRTPGAIVAERPLREGVIADYDTTEEMLKYFIKRATAYAGFGKPNLMVCVPSGVTEVEYMAVEQAAEKAGARKHPILFEEPILAAIGAGLPIEDAAGCMVVDIGGGTSEVAVLSMGGIVNSKSLKVAGDNFDDAIISYARREKNIILGERTAEDIKVTIGAAFKKPQEEYMDVKGRDVKSGLPKNVQITSSEIMEALSYPIGQILEAIKTTLELTPPELAADIMERGIMLTGGGALLYGLDQKIKEETGISAIIADNPLDCVVLGTAKCMENTELRRTLAQNRTTLGF